MIVAMPLAGKGQRFKDADIPTPKPYLPARGIPLVKRAISSVTEACRMEYAMSQEVAGYPLMSQLGLPSGCWHIVYLPTKGPLDTLATIENCLDKDEELLVLECDYFLDPKELDRLLKVWRESSGVGGSPVIHTSDPDVSYARVEVPNLREMWIIETREKEVFGYWSTTGPYWFRTGKIFVEAMKKARADGHTTISLVFNYLDRKGLALETKTFKHLGTPAALKAYNESA